MLNTPIYLNQLEASGQQKQLESPCFQLEKFKYRLFPEILHIFLHESRGKDTGNIVITLPLEFNPS